MNDRLLEKLMVLRTIVGYLGEREQRGWWQSSFFSPASATFLKPVFGKTSLVAQCTGVTRAAAIVHDERIGVGDVYHLFRLPEDVEQRMARLLLDLRQQQRLILNVLNVEVALQHLRHEATSVQDESVGPVYIGTPHDLRESAPWSRAAAHYLDALERTSQAFPYFARRTS
jgi:hypothetical protein